MDMAEDCRDITVHAESFDPRGGPVFYASLPCSSENFKGHRTKGPGDNYRLASILWDHLAGMENPLWKSFHSSHGTDFPVRVARGPLGRPRLLLGEYRGPAISFSEYGGNLWAALCGDRSDIGIDVAGGDEFQGKYPFHRVFNDHELQHALRLAGGELENASALLWSVKEAVVKALGCAFHLVDPLQINVHPPVAEGEGGFAFPVRLSGKALMRFPTGAESIWARSLPHVNMWLSIALLNRQSRRGR